MKKILTIIGFLIGLVLLIWLLVTLFNLSGVRQVLPWNERGDNEGAGEETAQELPGSQNPDRGDRPADPNNGGAQVVPPSSEPQQPAPPPGPPQQPSAGPSGAIPNTGPAEDAATLLGAMALMGSGYIYIYSRRRLREQARR